MLIVKLLRFLLLQLLQFQLIKHEERLAVLVVLVKIVVPVPLSRVSLAWDSGTAGTGIIILTKI